MRNCAIPSRIFAVSVEDLTDEISAVAASSINKLIAAAGGSAPLSGPICALAPARCPGVRSLQAAVQARGGALPASHRVPAGER